MAPIDKYNSKLYEFNLGYRHKKNRYASGWLSITPNPCEFIYQLQP